MCDDSRAYYLSNPPESVEAQGLRPKEKVAVTSDHIVKIVPIPKAEEGRIKTSSDNTRISCVVNIGTTMRYRKVAGQELKQWYARLWQRREDG